MVKVYTVNSKTFKDALNLINRSKSAIITCHQRPDGDAVGSMRAVCHALQYLGKKAQPLILTPMPLWYEYLFPAKVPLLGENKDITVEQLAAGILGKFDLAVIVDTNSNNQLPGFEDYLKSVDIPVLIFDHHVTNDGLGDVEVINTCAAATGQIVYEFLKYAKVPVIPEIAEALFVSISTDTGWFRYSNANDKVYCTAGELIKLGAKPCDIYKKMYQNFTPQRLALLVKMLDTLELHFNGRLAVQHLMWRDFQQTGATGRDTENLIDECRRISSVEVAMLLVELKDGKFKVSLRSDGKVDVKKIPEKYGGGGHVQAAGATTDGPLDTLKTDLLDEVAKQLSQSREL